MSASATTTSSPESDVVGKKSHWDVWRHLVNRFATTPKRWWQPYWGALMGCVIQSAVPYLWGLAMAVYSLSQLIHCDRCRRITSLLALFASVTLGVLILVLLTATLLPMVKAAPPGSSGAIAFALLVVAVLVALFLLVPLLHALLAARRRRWAYLYHGFVAAFLLLCPISLIPVLERALRKPELYAVPILVITSCLLLLSRVGEARAVSRLSWFWTILGLFLLRLHRWALPPGHCPACGYNLHALPEPRCPECGRPFTPEEAGLSPPDLHTAQPDVAIKPSMWSN